MDGTIISTKNGKVKGKVVTLKNTNDGKPVHVFRRIPFAKPPIGSLRFMPPQPADPWSEIIDGTQLGMKPMSSSMATEIIERSYPFPIAGDVEMSENCLHLTVYSPDPIPGKRLPVMVYFYGGAFMIGNEVECDGTPLAALNDVVVVIPNYRVGILGFFSLGPNSPCTGNAGILDQQMALRWVQENITDFGGDINNVTIFGESAGSFSVQLNIFSPLAKGLFHKAISHSGQVDIPYLFNDEEKNQRAINAALNYLNIEETDPLKILEALQAIPAEEIYKIGPKQEQFRTQFLPMIDGTTLEKSGKEYLMSKEFPQVPYIIGCNSTEGSGTIAIFSGLNQVDDFTEDIVKQKMYFKVSDDDWEELKKFYGNDDFKKLFCDSHQDCLFGAPAVRSAKAHAEIEASTFVYLGNFKLKMFHSDEYGTTGMRKPKNCVCDHVDDIFMTFGCPFSPNGNRIGAKYTEEEGILSRKWMTYLTNFAKTGNPNNGKDVDETWPDYKTGEILIVDHEMKTMKEFREEKATFWTENIQGFLP